MKTAEQWQREYKHLLPDHSDIVTELVREIQKDAWCQGVETLRRAITRNKSETSHIPLPELVEVAAILTEHPVLI